MPSLKEAIEEFDYRRAHYITNKNVKGYGNTLRQFAIYLRNPDASQVTTLQMLEYIDWLKEFGWAHNSLIERIMAFRLFADFAQRKGFIKEGKEDIPLPKKEFKIPRIVTAVEYEAMLQEIPKKGLLNIRNRALIKLLWNTGARNGELCSLSLDDLDTATFSAIIKTEKSRGRRPFRQIFWEEDTNRSLLEWLAVRKKFIEQREKQSRPVEDPEAVFLSILTKTNGCRLRPSGLSEITRKLANKCGFYTTPHKFRHSMGHRCVKAGVWPANILGHSDPHSSDIYTQMYGNEAKEQWERVKHFDRKTDKINRVRREGIYAGKMKIGERLNLSTVPKFDK